MQFQDAGGHLASTGTSHRSASVQLLPDRTWTELFFAAHAPPDDKVKTAPALNRVIVTPAEPLPVGEGWTLVVAPGLPSTEPGVKDAGNGAIRGRQRPAVRGAHGQGGKRRRGRPPDYPEVFQGDGPGGHGGKHREMGTRHPPARKPYLQGARAGTRPDEHARRNRREFPDRPESTKSQSMPACPPGSRTSWPRLTGRTFILPRRRRCWPCPNTPRTS